MSAQGVLESGSPVKQAPASSDPSAEQQPPFPAWILDNLSEPVLSADGTFFAKSTLIVENQGVPKSELSQLSNFPQITKLMLTGNSGLDDIGTITGLSSLRTIDVSNNSLRRILGFPAPYRLVHADFSHNQILHMNEVSEEYGSSLEYLSVAHNCIQSITGLSHLRMLVTLDLSNNEITKIANLGGLAMLRRLNLSQNRIEVVENLEPLANTLCELRLNNNGIKKLDGIVACPKLQIVDLSSNAIEKLDAAAGPLSNLPLLKELSLSNNPFTFELTRYTLDILYRIRTIAVLDGEKVTAEDKVKADIFYGLEKQKRDAARAQYSRLTPENSFFTHLFHKDSEIVEGRGEGLLQDN
eukprot:ANDGO_02529.mRNA.1 Protein phosphatase 1 regulatory subunit SDS22 homolog